MKLTDKQVTQAIASYARKHGYSASTIRTNTELHRAAVRAWAAKTIKLA